LRELLPQRFPGVDFAFLPADIVSQILNLGLPSPIDVQILGNNVTANREVARKLLHRLRTVPGLVDLRLQQTFDRPQLQLTVDRSRAREVNLTQRDIAQDLLINLSGSFQTAPTFWLNPANGVQYAVSTQTPQYRLQSTAQLLALPMGQANGADQTLGQPAQLHAPDGRLHVERLQVVAEVLVNVFVIVALGEFAKLPVEAVAAGVVVATVAPAVAPPVAEGPRKPRELVRAAILLLSL
jgi:multidrug efflux pump subunit AcrB